MTKNATVAPAKNVYRTSKEYAYAEQPARDLVGTCRIPAFRLSLIRESMEAGGRWAITSPAQVDDILRAYLLGSDRERFVVLLLDTKNKVIGINTVSVGDLSSAICHPRETFKAAIVAGAASIILAHNHPSGDPTPSPEDMRVTKRMMEAGAILGIDVLDHIIIGEDVYISLKQQGKI